MARFRMPYNPCWPMPLPVGSVLNKDNIVHINRILNTTMLPFITGGPKNHESQDEGEGKMLSQTTIL